MAVYITGDKHGDFDPYHWDYAKIEKFCQDHHTTKQDVMIVLGDHGVRFYPDDDWRTLKDMKRLEKMPIRFVLLRGNHDRRVDKSNPNLSYVQIHEPEIEGEFWFYDRCPSLLFPREYGHYRFAGHDVLMVCGAYSIDKQYRLDAQLSSRHPYWFPDEQLSNGERARAGRIYRQMVKNRHDGDILVMSHTCPLQYRPNHALLNQFGNLEEDTTMEQWMDEIADYRSGNGAKPWAKWYCGHFHIDETIDDVRFMYHDIILLEEATPQTTTSD